MSAETLKEKMQEFAEGKLGSIKVTSSDLTAEAGKKTDNEEAQSKSGTVMADVPKEAKDDAFTSAADTASMHQGMTPSFIEDKIDISDDDKKAFLHALVTGERYERPFSIFGGAITGIIRCRSIAESDGIISWMSHCINAKKLDARIEYMTLMRNAVLAAQIKCLRGGMSEDFPELPGPLGPVRSNDGEEVTRPGWLGLADSWGKRSEALVTAIHNEVQRFERRYWAMVVDAGNQNFWNPAASI